MPEHRLSLVRTDSAVVAFTDRSRSQGCRLRLAADYAERDGPIADGEDLKVSTNGRLTGGVAAGDQVIAHTISIRGGVLKFRLLI